MLRVLWKKGTRNSDVFFGVLLPKHIYLSPLAAACDVVKFSNVAVGDIFFSCVFFPLPSTMSSIYAKKKQQRRDKRMSGKIVNLKSAGKKGSCTGVAIRIHRFGCRVYIYLCIFKETVRQSVNFQLLFDPNNTPTASEDRLENL